MAKTLKRTRKISVKRMKMEKILMMNPKTDLTMTMKRAALKRDKNKCLHCGSIKNLQLSHIYPKGEYHNLEFEFDNVKILCKRCHLFWWHKNPVEAVEWLEKIIEKKRLDRLKLLKDYHGKGTSIDYSLYFLFFENYLCG